MTVRLTDEHLRKIFEHGLLKKDEINDPVKLGRVVQKSLDTALRLPDLPWHDWDESGKGPDVTACGPVFTIALIPKITTSCVDVRSERSV